MKCAALALALVACTYNTTNNYGPPPDAHAIDGRAADAPPPSPDAPILTNDPTSCGHALPATAPPSITISGTVYSVLGSGSGSPVGTTVALLDANGTARATTTVGANDTFTLTDSTGGVPIDGYLRVTGNGFADAYDVPAVPYAKDVTTEVIITDAGGLSSFAMFGSTPQDPHKAFLLMRTLDCANQPLAGATIDLTPPGIAAVSYPDSSGSGTSFASSTTSNGLAVANNVEPGDVKVGGAAGATPLRGHVVDARAETLTVVEVSE